MKNNWTVKDSTELYLIDRWGSPYFSVNSAGNISCSPTGESGRAIDLKALVDDLCRRGIEPPILIRFNDILKSRVAEISETFGRSIKEYGYKGNYRGVMPIKVNQQRHVVEELVSQGRAFGLGLEAGSKPELLVAMALLQDSSCLLVCNGYKDAEYIEIALNAQSIGLYPIIVLDRFQELPQLVKISRAMGIRPHIGIRAKLSCKGQGRWQDSSGMRSKFGLTPQEIVESIEFLKENEMLDCLEMLHFHIGSQITAVRAVCDATREAARVYCNLRQMGCTTLTRVDIGGGLAIDYDGSRTDFHSSMNYSMQEYANDVISVMQDICDENEQPHPNIISESGRALVAHHSVLIFNVLGVSEMTDLKSIPPTKPDDELDHNVIHLLYEAYNKVSQKNYQEPYNDAITAREESNTLFAHGVIDLATKARAEDLYWRVCRKIQKIVHTLPYVPEEFEDLDRNLSDTVYCNFSVFQSIPDSWAISHLFPITPIHRLNEEPTKDAVLADLTCDSDGKVDKFIDLRDVKKTLKLHSANGNGYYLGAFLVGAYQEILGDLHNLFGDTNAVHVSMVNESEYKLEQVIPGDTVRQVLSYVEYNHEDLIHRIRILAEKAVRSGQMTLEQSARLMRQYEHGLAGYTYLEDID